MFDTQFFSGFGRQVADLRSQVTKLTDAITAKEAEIERLRTAPPSREDVLDAMSLVLRVRAESARMLIERSIEEWHRRPLALEDAGAVSKMRLVGAAPGGTAPTPLSLEFGLVAVLPEQIEAGLRRIVDGMEWPEAGPPIGERKDLIAKAEKELIGLQRNLASLREQAADAGVIL